MMLFLSKKWRGFKMHDLAEKPVFTKTEAGVTVVFQLFYSK
jgi:hypothetical protein